MREYLLVCVVAAAVTFGLTPLVRVVAVRIDTRPPNGRRPSSAPRATHVMTPAMTRSATAPTMAATERSESMRPRVARNTGSRGTG